MIASALSVPLLLSAVSLSTPTVPATGRATALVTLDKPAMVRLTAQSPSGTACEVVDRVRGPFAQDGVAGRRNCALDLLLDQGAYKLRLESSRRGKGKAKLSAVEFVELNTAPQRLVPGSLTQLTLKSGQQASYWLHITDRAAPNLRVSGRTAGDVRLWRNGQWVEPAGLSHDDFSPEPGRPIHEWWLSSPLEEGDYLVTVYGTQAHEWPGGAENDALELELGFRNGPPEQALGFTLGRSGIAAVRVPAESWMALLSLDAAPPNAVELVADGVATRGQRCRIEKKAQVPQCAVTAYGDTLSHVLMVRGPAGAKGVLEWAHARNGKQNRGGYYGSAENQLPFWSSGGISLVTLHDLPADPDAAPLGCMVTRAPKGERVIWDFPQVGDGKKLDASFNYDGSSAIVWFEVKRGGKYHVETMGGRKNRCELYRFVKESDIERVSQTQPDAKACVLDLVLSPGPHQLSLFDGLQGIEHLVITEAGAKNAQAIPLKASCLLPAVPLGGDHALVTNRTGAVTARGLIVEDLPLRLDHPLHLTLDPGAKISLPMTPVSGTIVRSAAGAPFKCGGTAAMGGECAVKTEKLELENPGDTPIGVVVLRPGAAVAPASLETWAPKLQELRAAKADAPVFFDFEPGESHSLVFDVDKAGLYNVSTQGLLSTTCALRTPVIADVAHDQGSGRGRNCLVAGYLRPGRYMMTVSTIAPSRGRASVLLTRRPARDQGAVVADSEAFFRVAPGDLVQQRLVVPKPGTYELATTAQGAGGALRCRLDDNDGWPLTAVPTSCTSPRSFAKGTYLWTQLPLTVESMRHTRIAKEAPPLVLKGPKPHPVDFFTWYQTHLNSTGKDTFTFKLDGAADVDIVLTKGMQGRLFLMQDGKAPKAIEVVPPMESRDAPPEEQEQPEGEGEQVEQEAPPPEGEYAECEGEGCGEREDQPPRQPAVQPVAVENAPPPPQGFHVSLEAGSYQLVTEHSRGDVAIDYQLHLGSAVLMPGMTRTLPAPARLPIAVPRDGTLRLRTSGEADVRCRLFDASGKLVLEGSENGPDWNCSIAEPITKGRYMLVIESETQLRSETKLSLALAAVEDKGPLTDGAEVKLAAPVQTFALPGGDAVQDLTLKSKVPFSCALEDGAGEVVFRKSRTTECAMLVRSDKHRVRLWTTERAAQVGVALKSRPASVVKIAAPGLYRTAPKAFCLPKPQTGALRACGPEVSLDAGDVVFAEAVSPSEATLSESKGWSAPLSRLPWIEAVTSNGVTLLEAHVQHGERAAPACGFMTGGVRDSRAYDCFAASNAGARSVARLWAQVSDDAPIAATAKVRTVAVPAKRGLLKPGRQRLEWTGEAGAWDMPAGRTRVTLTLAPGAWAVLQDSNGKALDVCAPTGELTACAFTGAGGRVLLAGDKELRADASIVVVDAPEKAVAFNGLYEETPRQPGQVKLDIPSGSAARTLVVEGAQRCVTTLSDGMRLTGCRAELGAGLSGELRVEHASAPLRVMVFNTGREKLARLGLELPVVPGAPLPVSTAVPLTQGRIDRTLIVDKDSVVRVSTDSGVCGLYKGNDLLAVDGLDSGCEVVRLLSPGTYRAVVRPFGAYVVPGSLKWTSEPIVALKEGVGAEEWLAPSEARLYRFQTQSKGSVGFGVQTRDEALDCAIYDDGYKLLGEGCQQFLSLDKGTYLLTVRLPQKPGAAPLRFKPVLLGLAGAKAGVPQAYLEDFFNRIGGRP